MKCNPFKSFGATRFLPTVFYFQVAGMYQDPSIGKIRVFYMVKKIFHIKSTETEVLKSN